MYGNISPRRNTPRLPPIEDPKIAYLEDRLKKQEETTNTLIDRLVRNKEDIVNSHEFTRSNIIDERRSRQLLEEHIRVITAVCKKLNNDIEAIDTQLNEKTFQNNNSDFRLKDVENNLVSFNKDLQFKMTRYDNTLNKLESEHFTMNNGVRDLQQQFVDFNRAIMTRLHDIENRMSELNSKFDSVLTEQTVVLKNVEGDTVKQLQLIDGRTRTMLEDVRSQINMSKASIETDMARLESRMLQKIDEASKSNDKYDRLDRRMDEYSSLNNKKFSKFEDDYQRQLTKLTSSVDKLETKVYRGLDDRYAKIQMDYDRQKKDLKAGFENVQDSIAALQKVIDGKIRLSEDKLEKELDKIRKMVVLM